MDEQYYISLMEDNKSLLTFAHMHHYIRLNSPAFFATNSFGFEKLTSPSFTSQHSFHNPACFKTFKNTKAIAPPCGFIVYAFSSLNKVQSKGYSLLSRISTVHQVQRLLPVSPPPCFKTSVVIYFKAPRGKKSRQLMPKNPSSRGNIKIDADVCIITE